MKSKILVLLIIAAFLLSVAGLIFADTKKPAKNNELVALLPASDMVMTLDTQRLMSQALPQVFSANQAKLNEINAKIDQVKTKTGLDLRQFQQVAVGVSTKEVAPKKIDFEPFALARGNFSAGALVSVAKLAANGKYREEKIGKRTVYVFTAKEIIEQNKPNANNSMMDKMFDKLINSLTREVAVTTYDNNTLAFGSLARVREAFETKTRVSAEVLGLANRNPNALLSFGAKLPNGLSNFINLDNDELGKNLDAIRQMSGALNVDGGNATVSLMAKTLNDQQAQGLHETLEGLQMLGKGLLGGMKGEDKKVYARMAENARITRSGSEISFNLQVPQTDINILLSNPSC